MPLTILTDGDVCEVLDSLSREDVFEIHRKLADALHTYSTAVESEEMGCCAANQPKRISVKRKGGPTTLFMPAMSDEALGVKIATLSEGNNDGHSTKSLPVRTSVDSPATSPRVSSPNPRSALSETPRASSPSLSKSTRSASPSPFPGSPRSSSPAPSILKTSSSSSSSLRKDSSSTTSRTPTTATSSASSIDNIGFIKPGTPLTSIPSLPQSTTSPTGSLTLLSSTGQPRALLNCSTLTAFRTALSSMFLFKARQSVHTLTVFGAGLQAYWHIHLALLLRGPEIHHLHLINRNFERAQRLFIKLAQHPNEALESVFVGGKLRPSILTPEYGEYTRLLKEHVRGADVIFCTTPSTTPLFPAGYLTNTEGRRKARYVAAIGSYKPHMQELHEDILLQAVRGPSRADDNGDDGKSHGSHHHGLALHHRHANEGGAVVVDTIEGAMREAGEVIKAGIGGQGVVELGELVMLKRTHWAEKADREAREREKREKEGKKVHEKGGHGIGHLFYGHHFGGHHEEREEERRKREEAGGDGGLQEWLKRGNVVYKSVGIGLMDVVVGMEVVRLAEERGIGTTIPDF